MGRSPSTPRVNSAFRLFVGAAAVVALLLLTAGLGMMAIESTLTPPATPIAGAVTPPATPAADPSAPTATPAFALAPIAETATPVFIIPQLAFAPPVQTATVVPTPTPSAGEALPPQATHPVQDALPGFNFGGQVQEFVVPDKMRWAGMGWVKFQINEGDVNWIDKLNKGKGEGFRVLLSVVGNRSRATDPAYYQQYTSYLARLAASGADAIEVWNEPNLDRDWPTGQIDPRHYINLLRASYQAVKAVSPNTMVISAGLASTWMAENLRSANFWTETAYSTDFVANGGLFYTDCVGVHYNVGTTPPDHGDPKAQGDAALQYYPQVVSYYTGLTRGARPICFTELGYLSPEGYPSLTSMAPAFSWAQNITVKNQSDWLTQAVGLARANPLVKMLIIWNVDFWAYGSDPHAGYAIVRYGGGCPACDSLRSIGWP